MSSSKAGHLCVCEAFSERTHHDVIAGGVRNFADEDTAENSGQQAVGWRLRRTAIRSARTSSR
jgi:hypothetical protein